MLWNKLRGRPTVQADRGAVAAGRDQTINAPLATSGSMAAGGQATIATSESGGTTIVVQSGGMVNLVSSVDGLPQAKDPLLRAAFEEGQRLQQEGYEAQSAHKHREAIDRFTRALELAENDSQRAALHVLRGNSCYSISQYDEAQTDYEKTLKLAERISPVQDAAEARAAALSGLGLVCSERGDLEKAEEHHKQALDIHRKIGDRQSEAATLDNLGTVYGRRGALDQAEECFKQALAIDKEIGSSLGEATVLGNLGIVYRRRGEMQKAEKHHKKALKIAREIGNRLGEANHLGNLGIVYGQRNGPGDLDKAEKHFKQALEIAGKIGYRLGEAADLANLGNVYRQRGDLSKAREYLQQAQTIYQKIGARGEGPDIVRRWLAELERGQQERGE